MIRHTCTALTLIFALSACLMEEDEYDTGYDEHEISVDNDRDGIDDGLEDTLLQRHAPIVYLNINDDWTRPANVHWMMARSRLRMHHTNCSDTQIAYYPNTTTLLGQNYRRRVRGWLGCSWKTPWIRSDGGWHDNDHYFLQFTSDSHHVGIPTWSSNQWIVYGHVYKNAAGGYNVQYWMFYAYNDWVSYANHEGDFEMITVSLNANQTIRGVYYAQHENVSYYTKSSVSWSGNRPIVYSADGSHASYKSGGRFCGWFNAWYDDCAGSGEYSHRWFTGAGTRGAQLGYQGGGVVNVGELDYPRPGQEWIRFSGRWGEKGNFDGTSGPEGPAYKDSWTIGAPSSGGGGGGSGGDDGDEGDPGEEEWL